MEIIWFLLPVALSLSLLSLWGFFWSVKNEQFSDLDSPAFKMLIDDENLKKLNSMVNEKEKS